MISEILTSVTGFIGVVRCVMTQKNKPNIERGSVVESELHAEGDNSPIIVGDGNMQVSGDLHMSVVSPLESTSKLDNAIQSAGCIIPEYGEIKRVFHEYLQNFRERLQNESSLKQFELQEYVHFDAISDLVPFHYHYVYVLIMKGQREIITFITPEYTDMGGDVYRGISNGKPVSPSYRNDTRNLSVLEWLQEDWDDKCEKLVLKVIETQRRK